MATGTKAKSKERSLFWRIYWSVLSSLLHRARRRHWIAATCCIIALPCIYLLSPRLSLHQIPNPESTSKSYTRFESILDLQNRIARNESSCASEINSFLNKIESKDGQIHSVIWKRSKAEALRVAQRLDTLPRRKRRLLFCVPVVVKDNLDTTFLPTTAGSKAFKSLPSPSRNAAVVNMLLQQQAVILGKANMDEFALGYKTLSTLGGQTRNPFALDYSPGGSSGGSAAAVAANFAVVGIGTDTGGSIRIPSSFNNLVGLRPTQDLVSVQGVVPLSHSRDTVGPIVRYPSDAAVVMDAIVSKQKKKLLIAPNILGQKQPKRLRSCVLGGRFQLRVNQSRIGVMDSMLGSTEGIREVILNAVSSLDSAGATIIRMKTPTITKKSLSKHKSSSFWEFADDLAQYLADRTRDSPKNTRLPLDLSAVVKLTPRGTIRSGLEKKLKFAKSKPRTSAVHEAAYQEQVIVGPRRLRDHLLSEMQKLNLDVVVYPTFTYSPAHLKKSQPFCSNNRLAASTGLPAVSVPAGWYEVNTGSELPVGLEMIGAPYGECILLGLADDYMRLFGNAQQRSPEP